MEIVKQNEQYQISESLENGWKMTGTFNKNVNGTINISFSVSLIEENIGSYNYYKSVDRVSANYEVAETNRIEFVEYTNQAVDHILNSLVSE